jgi:hypothetical protein
MKCYIRQGLAACAILLQGVGVIYPPGKHLLADPKSRSEDIFCNVRIRAFLFSFCCVIRRSYPTLNDG